MSKTTTIRVNNKIYSIIKSLARQENENMQDVLEKAVENYKRKMFFEKLNNAYAKLKADPEAWEQELIERKEWDTVLTDGLEENDES
jgi:predicted transcriptional regulator